MYKVKRTCTKYLFLDYLTKRLKWFYCTCMLIVRCNKYNRCKRCSGQTDNAKSMPMMRNCLCKLFLFMFIFITYVSRNVYFFKNIDYLISFERKFMHVAFLDLPIKPFYKLCIYHKLQNNLITFLIVKISCFFFNLLYKELNL